MLCAPRQHHRRPCLLSAEDQALLKRERTRRPQSLLHGPTLAAASVCAVVLAGSCLVWIAWHPRPRPAIAVAAVAPQDAGSADPREVRVRSIEPPASVVPASPPSETRKDVERRKTRDALVPLAAVPLPASESCGPRPQIKRITRSTYGTALAFVDDPAEATRLAREEDRILFLLHVSGNFEESCFT